MIDINRILCPVDFSPFSERALMVATQMAKWYGAALQVVHVTPPLPPSTVNELAAASRRLTARTLNTLVDRCRMSGVDAATELIESADTAAKILASAERFDADLVITGSHGRSGVQRVLHGSVVEALLHKSGRPVLTVPGHVDRQRLDRPFDFRRILCAVDFSASSLGALAVAFSIAEEVNAQMTLLHVIEMPPELRPPSLAPELDNTQIRAAAEAERLTRLRALVPAHATDYCAVRTVVMEGAASRQILREAAAQHADLIVLGVRDRSVFDLAFFGSNSKDVIREAHCPVLVIPASRRTAVRAAS